jgi:(p)ppGpp synthase/HD superfamily hydrolase
VPVAMGYTMGDLIGTLSKSGRHGDISQVWHAYEFAKRAHGRQRRVGGERYITHPVAVAGIVASHGGGVPAICAALLHDVIEDTPVTSNRLHAWFGPGVAGMVEGLTLGAVHADPSAAPELVLIVIADRLHNMRTISPLRPARRQRASLDTLVFHVPLANRLQITEIATDAIPGPPNDWRRCCESPPPGLIRHRAGRDGTTAPGRR